jgi:ABC-type multidrug transport system ATPase subunit
MSGEMLALMGPSGCGKTTLLNTLARRSTSSSDTSGSSLIDGSVLSLSKFQKVSSYVEQEDALIGSLTVRETVDFSARLALAGLSKRERLARVDKLLQAFGLADQANTLIGTPLRQGISGGQKRRTSVAAQIITNPKILFLDEPTSGLDSAASFEIISHLKTVARQYNLLVVASIHQPSTSTFVLFDKLLLLSQGKTCYFGTVPDVAPYFDSINLTVPPFTNPAEHLLDMTNIDFSRDRHQAQLQLESIHSSWGKKKPSFEPKTDDGKPVNVLEDQSTPDASSITLTLLSRMFIKSHRDVVAYGIRIAMYMGLAIMMGTVWLRLPTTQESIQPFINAIFFGSAFMSFMAVAYVPAYLEDRATFVKDRANGLYGATPFLIANFLIGLPYLFLIAVLFSTVAYWLSNFRPSGTAFLTWIMWLFLDLLAAESLVVLVSSLFPIFVLSLAIVAFSNGLWMSVGGFLVTPTILNVFWKYVFHYIDYQVRLITSPFPTSHLHLQPSHPPSPHTLTSPLLTIPGVRLPRHDGQRVLASDLLLRPRLSMHVCDRAGISVQDCRHGGFEHVWLFDWQDGRMGGYSLGYYPGLQTSRMVGFALSEVGLLAGKTGSFGIWESWHCLEWKSVTLSFE